MNTFCSVFLSCLLRWLYWLLTYVRQSSLLLLHISKIDAICIPYFNSIGIIQSSKNNVSEITIKVVCLLNFNEGAHHLNFVKKFQSNRTNIESFFLIKDQYCLTKRHCNVNIWKRGLILINDHCCELVFGATSYDVAAMTYAFITSLYCCCCCCCCFCCCNV